jgi:GR25 family glycosyltransferase involved in LPS biosynthesis
LSSQAELIVSTVICNAQDRSVDSNFETEDATDLKPIHEQKSIIHQIILINLKRCPDRLEKMKKQLDILKLPFKKIQAIDKQNISTFCNSDLKDKQFLESLDPRIDLKVAKDGPCLLDLNDSHKLGAFACTLSHLHAMLYGLDTISNGKATDGPILILEDDSIMDAHFVSRTNHLIAKMNEINEDWELLILGCNKILNSKGTDKDILHKCLEAYGAHAHLYKDGKALQKAFAFLNSSKFQYADVWWWEQSKSEKYSVYVYKKNNLIVQDSALYSTVEDKFYSQNDKNLYFKGILSNPLKLY